ncbi:MAG: PEP-CTERM sorting domain-containing protein, partial [Kiritimatiellaeota bacterium]|nr:PEP-CTERM sorting domain-containing protein [Kiritimatiellota bacterium]
LLRLDLTQYDADTSGSVQQQFTVLTYNTSSVFNSADTNQCFLLQDWGTAAQLSIVLTNNMTFAVGGGSSATNFFTINYDDLANGSTASITLTAVPEPGTASLLGLIGVAFLVRRLRRRTQKT